MIPYILLTGFFIGFFIGSFIFVLMRLSNIKNWKKGKHYSDLDREMKFHADKKLLSKEPSDKANQTFL